MADAWFPAVQISLFAVSCRSWWTPSARAQHLVWWTNFPPWQWWNMLVNVSVLRSKKNE
jgi:hypothetical protein